MDTMARDSERDAIPRYGTMEGAAERPGIVCLAAQRNPAGLLCFLRCPAKVR